MDGPVVLPHGGDPLGVGDEQVPQGAAHPHDPQQTVQTLTAPVQESRHQLRCGLVEADRLEECQVGVRAAREHPQPTTRVTGQVAQQADGPLGFDESSRTEATGGGTGPVGHQLTLMNCRISCGVIWLRYSRHSFSLLRST